MIITLEEARAIDKTVQQEDIDAFEIMFRAHTNNNFQNISIRYEDVDFLSDNVIGLRATSKGLKPGDTVQINYSGYNDGLYTIKEINSNEYNSSSVLVFNEESFAEIDLKGAMLTKVEYPADIKAGIKKILRYDEKMKDKTGVKSESYARMSVTYHDVNAEQNIEGYPSNLLAFLSKYEKMRW